MGGERRERGGEKRAGGSFTFFLKYSAVPSFEWSSMTTRSKESFAWRRACKESTDMFK
jgi:hypothetical protein